jgi:hypothetical protein
VASVELLMLTRKRVFLRQTEHIHSYLRSSGDCHTFVVPSWSSSYAGADRGLQVRGEEHLKILRRAEGGAKMFGVFRVKNHDFTQKNDIFFQF